MILTDRIKYQYDVWKGDIKAKKTALDGVSIEVKSGEFLVILGGNGSGKTTLARHLNVLLLPDEGTVRVEGMDTRDETHLWDIRSAVGMVFQNPDNQIIGTSVEEDVAFGPENRNLESSVIQDIVTNSLSAVDLLSRRKSSPHRLSGGQKQRVAVAGVLADDPRCMVFDEATSMLDPISRREFMEVVRKLHAEGRTVVLITHHSDEALSADRIAVMDKGRVAAEGTPEEIFADGELLSSAGLNIPPLTELGYALRKRGVIESSPVLDRSALIAELIAKSGTSEPLPHKPERRADARPAGEIVLSVRDVEYTYEKGTANEYNALKGVSFELREGECVGLVGSSGAGKSTLMKHLNGLLKADKGDVLYRGESIYRKGYKLSELRKSVGLVFQNSENQLFCKTVLDDVKFGPLRIGMSEAEATKAAKESLALMDIDEECFDVSPQDLSGGQKRRVAIAGIIAMEPAVLVLDEPAAGLDFGTKEKMFSVIDDVRRERGVSVVLVSHEMEDIAKHSDRVMVLSEGRMEMTGTPKEVFSQVERVRRLGADVPEITGIMYELRNGGVALDGLETDTEAAADAIAAACGREVSVR